MGAVIDLACWALKPYSSSSPFLSYVKPEALEGTFLDFPEALPNRGTCVKLRR